MPPDEFGLFNFQESSRKINVAVHLSQLSHLLQQASYYIPIIKTCHSANYLYMVRNTDTIKRFNNTKKKLFCILSCTLTQIFGLI